MVKIRNRNLRSATSVRDARTNEISVIFSRVTINKKKKKILHFLSLPRTPVSQRQICHSWQIIAGICANVGRLTRVTHRSRRLTYTDVYMYVRQKREEHTKPAEKAKFSDLAIGRVQSHGVHKKKKKSIVRPRPGGWTTVSLLLTGMRDSCDSPDRARSSCSSSMYTRRKEFCKNDILSSFIRNVNNRRPNFRVPTKV